jgi:hypothetical protein
MMEISTVVDVTETPDMSALATMIPAQVTIEDRASLTTI